MNDQADQEAFEQPTLCGIDAQGLPPEIELVPTYITSDGVVHLDLEAARDHVAHMAVAPLVEEYLAEKDSALNDAELPRAQRAVTRERNNLIAWEAWKARKKGEL